jgi:hypothetical protein
MSAPAVTSLPSGRAVLGWWRELSALRPHRLWFAQLLLNRVEALVEIGPPAALSGLSGALLAIGAHIEAPISRDNLAAELHTDVGLLEVLLAGTRRTRRSFWFVAERPPLYLPLVPGAAATPTPVADAPGSPQCSVEEGVFDLATLDTCLGQSADWKARHGFPAEIVRVVRPSPDLEDWLAVPLLRCERAVLALVEMTPGGEVVGFPVRPDGWTLARETILNVPGGVAVLAPLLDEVDPHGWKQAWQQWSQQRNLPAGEVDACHLELAGHRLLVRAPARLVERLRAARSDALKGEAWLLAGTGRVRATAEIELGESG